MYLHLGGDTLTPTGDIIGLFDIDTTSISPRTRQFLAAAQRAGQVEEASFELPKSFCVAAPARRAGRPGAGVQRVLISQLNTATLKKRLANPGLWLI